MLNLFNIIHFSSTFCFVVKNQEKNESQQHRDLRSTLLPGRNRSCRLQVHCAWGRVIMDIKMFGVQVFKKTDRSDLISSLQQIVPKLDYDRVWSSQEWKVEAAAHDRSRRPDKTSWR